MTAWHSLAWLSRASPRVADALYMPSLIPSTRHARMWRFSGLDQDCNRRDLTVCVWRAKWLHSKLADVLEYQWAIGLAGSPVAEPREECWQTHVNQNIPDWVSRDELKHLFFGRYSAANYDLLIDCSQVLMKAIEEPESHGKNLLASHPMWCLFCALRYKKKFCLDFSLILTSLMTSITIVCHVDANTLLSLT